MGKKLRNPSVNDGVLLAQIIRADPLNEIGRWRRSTQLEYLHNLTTLYVGKYRDPATGRIDPDADANQFFLNCTLAKHDE